MREGDSLESGGRSWPLAPLALDPNYKSNEKGSYPDHFKAFALVPGSGAETIATFQGKPVGIRNGRITYIAAEWPHFAGLPENWLDRPATNNAASRCVLFAYRRGDEQVLAGVARQAKPVTGTVDSFGFRLRLENCVSFVVSKKGDRVNVLSSEGTVEAQ